MRLPLTLTVSATFGLAAIFSLAAASLTATVIEDSSQSAVQAALDKQGLTWSETHAEGLNVFIAGTAPSEAQRFIAMSTAAGVVDAARVIDNMNVTATADLAPPKFSIEILRNESGISLIGLIPEASDRRAVLTKLRRIAGSQEQLADFMETAAYVTPKNWPQAMNFALAALEDLPRSKISITAGEITITAMTDSPKERFDLEQQLRDDKPDSVALSLNIFAPRPVITPFTLRATLNDGNLRFDACSADTEAAQVRILQAAEQAGLTSRKDCTIGLGVPSPKWADASVIALNALTNLGGGTVTITDADISLVAAEGIDAALFDKTVAQAEKSLPEVFALHAVLPVVQTDGEVDLPEFIATLSPEGLMQMRGKLGSDLSSNTVASYAKARFGSDNIYDSIRVTETMPNGWPNRVMTGLDALSTLHHGAVTVTADQIRVSGKSGHQDVGARISQLLSKRLGETQQFSLDVAYDERLDPLANIPTPEDCVARIQAAQSEVKISFEPGSGTLDAAAMPIIGAIAEILDTCGELPLEIQGHTDSQGRESMNLALSQNRAQSVLAALRDRRILTSAFTAQGYGEANPIADNKTEAGREANRRIEFVLIQPEAEILENSEVSDQEGLENKADKVNEDAADTSSAAQE
ncbi:OmpA family protein [Cognatishimia sp. WU-CL00825]|uniref:OmpA family protein n=1 Tax=Cognatishimia sp. WU-CL00825 TaxID=3127658 RepID=UPI0031096858